MGSCPEVKILELYTLGGLEDDLTYETALHVRDCKACQTALDDFLSYYRCVKEMDKGVEEKVAQRVIRKSGAAGPRILRLIPAAERSESGQYILAAQENKTPRFRTLQSYVNVENDCIVRLISDNWNHTLTLYLVSANRGCLDEPIVEFEGIPKLFLTDSEGHIVLSGVDEADIEHKILHLKSPIASFDLEPMDGLREKIVLEGRFELKNHDFDHIQIEVLEEGGKKTYGIRILRLKDDDQPAEVRIVVAKQGSTLKSSPAPQGLAVFEDLDLEKALKVRIY